MLSDGLRPPTVKKRVEWTPPSAALPWPESRMDAGTQCVGDRGRAALQRLPENHQASCHLERTGHVQSKDPYRHRGPRSRKEFSLFLRTKRIGKGTTLKSPFQSKIKTALLRGLGTATWEIVSCQTVLQNCLPKPFLWLLIFHSHQIEPAGWRRRSRGRAVSSFQYPRDVIDVQRGFSYQNERPDEIANHVMKKS
jgi:hypothetical protein